jgi:CHASE2 domain-containing sensor protein
VKLKAIAQWKHFRPVMGAVLAVLCGLVLWGAPICDWWVDGSYDYQFLFGTHAVTNKVVLIQMDNRAYNDFHQQRFDPDHNIGQPWDRRLHARLLQKLADGGASLVVLDTFFRATNTAEGDEALAAGLRRQSNVVLMAKDAKVEDPTFVGVQPNYPAEIFMEAARSNCGVAKFDADSDGVVRKHWPFPSPGPSTPAQFQSLAWAAAELAGASLDNDHARERWLRYYHEGAWVRTGYRDALEEDPATNFFGKIVFIGSQPQTTEPRDPEVDKFRTPFTRLGKSMGGGMAWGGVDLNITEFLNLLNNDWLERLPAWAEALALVVSGILLGGGLCKLRPLPALFTAAIVAIAVTLVCVSWSYYGKHWFPWLVIAGGQVPFALGWAIFMPAFYRVQDTITIATLTSARNRNRASGPAPTPPEEMPEAPDYELFDPPFGEGSYGKVWIAKNAIGQLQALKVVYLSKFDNHTDPFDREFNGISHYKPISDKHPGLLRVDFVSRKRDGYFYYVMELGDPLKPGWERNPSSYRPRDLVSVQKLSPGKRLPVKECIRIGIALSDALEFLHQQGLTHRDIKPQNIIFVNGQPKLADVGLTQEIRPLEAERTFVGTPGYMPPPPERPGTAQADIYALGMVLYVLSTGRAPTHFPDLATTLVQSPGPEGFLPLNNVILKACEADLGVRYKTAADFKAALEGLEKGLGDQ